MKTIAKTLIAISILMISLQVIAGNNQTITGKVHYKVQIHIPNDISFNTSNIFVVMTDQRNIPVAPPQMLRSGKIFYDFYESQTVIGTRMAKLIYSDGNTTALFHSTPDVQNGKFGTGCTYLFNLYVVFTNPVLSTAEK